MPPQNRTSPIQSATAAGRIVADGATPASTPAPSRADRDDEPKENLASPVGLALPRVGA